MPDQVVGRLSPWLRERRIAAVLPFLSGDVLDFGCGVGHLAPHVTPERYQGVDRDTESIAQAKAAHPGYRFSAEIPAGRRYDTIAALAVLEHLKNPAAFINDMAQRLNPNGAIVLTTPHKLFEWTHTAGAAIGLFSHHACDEHETLFDKAGLRALAENGGLRMARYRRFLFGANQLAILRQGAGCS